MPNAIKLTVPGSSLTMQVEKAAMATVGNFPEMVFTGTNLDTGDAAGDAFFGYPPDGTRRCWIARKSWLGRRLYEKSAPVVCRHDSTSLLCTNEPLLQIPGNCSTLLHARASVL